MSKLSFKIFYERIKKIKNIEYFILILAIAIVISMVSNIFTDNNSNTQGTPSRETASIDNTQDNIENYTKEHRLKQVLSAIKGAGSVEIMISYKSGKEIVPAINSIESSTETEETDNNGGIRRIIQSDTNSQPVSLSTSNGAQPLITKEVEPEIQGVIVVAEGAEDIQVRIELQNAVQTLLGISANQVEVFVMETIKIKE